MPWTPGQTSLGGAVPVALPELPRLENETALAYGISDSGTLVYLAGGPSRTRNRIVWVDHTGRTEALRLPEREYESVAISPIGDQSIVQVFEGTLTLWILDLARESLTPFVTSGSSQAPLWTPGGTHVIYRGTRNGVGNLYRKKADGTGIEERLTEKIDVVQSPTSISSNGEWLFFIENSDIGGTVWSTTVPRVLFEGEFKPSSNSNTPYDISLDDRRFLRVQTTQPESGISEIEVVLNWISQLPRR